MTAVRLPLLRRGRPHESVDRDLLRHAATGEPLAEVSRAEPALIARDLDPERTAAARRALAERPAGELAEICRRAADLFDSAELPAGDGVQGFGDYVRRLSGTTGIPETMVRANAEKIRSVLDGVEGVIAGLTRGLDPAALDEGWTEEDGRIVAYRPETDVLGAVLPSNSPGVHGLWLPAPALKVPVALKPGSREPWTPYRVAQAMIAAGCPAEAFSFYPTGHGGAMEILLRSGRSLLFGDKTTVAPWAGDPRVELHGPGWSKVIVGRDRLGSWEESLDLIEESVAANGGRSCINASSVWVARSDRHGGDGGGNGAAAGASPARRLAEALAERLARVEALPLDHPGARLAAFPDPAVARRISEHVDRLLAGGGAEDLTARHRGSRVAEAGGCTFLLPTVVWCDDPGHPLVGTELLFPFVSVVEVDQDEIPARLGPTLAATVLTGDAGLARALAGCRAIDRLNLGDGPGAVPTCRVSWDQPHEGNLFEHLYRRRALGGPGLALAAGAATSTGAAP